MINLDDRILEHPKFVRAVSRGDSGVIHLWLGIRAFCAQHLTDGKIDRDMIEHVRGPRDSVQRSEALAVLIDVGLIEDHETHYEMHGYRKWGKTRRKVEAERKQWRERQSRARHGVTPSRPKSESRIAHAVTNKSSPVRSSPVLISDPPVVPQEGDTSETKVAARVRKKPRRDMPEDFVPSEKHRGKAVSLGVNCDSEFEKFRAWVQANGKQFADWHAAFMNWLLNANEFKRNGSRPAQTSGPLSLPQQAEVDRILRRVGR